MKNKKLVVISTLLLSLGLTACGNDFPSFASYEQGDDGSFHHEFVPYDNGKRIETITLSENDVKLNINETKEYQINATFAPSDAANPYLYYLSNNPDIVSVDENGKVTIANTGSASVTVSSDTGVSTDLNLEIYKPVEAISVLPHVESDTGYVCDISETRQFAVGYTPVDTTQKEVTWSIVDSNNLNPGDVTIDANGLLTVNAPQGTKDASFLVKAVSTANENIFATEKVTVNDNRVYAEGVAIYQGETDVSDSELEVTLGETLSLSAKTTPEETTAGKIYWESSNPSVLTVDENGLVTPVKAPATADVTVSVDGHSAKVTINTIKVDVTSVTLDKHSLALTKGDIASLEATVAPDNASIKDVRYVVESGDAYVSVDQDGKVTAKASTQGGTANIRCVSVDNPEIYDDCEVTVTNAVISIEVLSSASVLHNGGEETDLSVSCLPIDADPFTVTWSSSDDSIATIDQSGHVTTNSSGLTGFVTFTATVDGTSISHGKTIEVIDPLPDFAWGIAGTKSGWVLDERAPFVEATAEGTALYTYKTEYEFEVGDEWKVTNTNGEWVYNNLGEVGINISKSTIGAVAISGEDNNISMNIAGTYEITLNIFEGAQKDEQGNFYSGIEIIAIGKNLPGQPKYAYVLNGGTPVELTQGTDPDGNPQLEALDIEMSAGNTLVFENIAPDTPEVLTSLVIGGDDAHGFTIDEGVLTASKDGTFNFYVKLAYGNDVVYISEKTVEPIYAYVLNNNDPVPLQEGTDPEGNPQLQVEGLVMSEGDTILFENIAPKTPEVLTSLTIGGDDAHGFTIDEGILTSSKDGTFNFYVKLIYGGDVVYISESSGPEPTFMWGVASKSNSWALDTENPFVETTKEDDELYCYKITGYEFAINDEWKVKNTNNEWVSNSDGVGFDLSRSTADAFSIADGNIKVLTAGTYDITLRIWEGAVKDKDGNFTNGVQIYAVKQAGPGPTPVDPTSVSIDQDEPITVINGETTTLTATLGPSGATGTLVWSSNNPDVISVDSASGVLTGKADSGTAVITVKVDGFDDINDSVTVTAAPVPEFAWALATSASDWKLDSSLKFTETDVPAESDAKYAYTGEFTLDAELEFKVTNTNGEWVKNDTGVGFDSSKSTAGAFEVVNGNVVVKANDTYTFTLLIWEGAAKDGNDFISGVSFYAVGTEVPPTPVTDTYYVKVGTEGEKQELNYNKVSKEYYLDNIALDRNDTLEFYNGDEKLTIVPKDNTEGYANNCFINSDSEIKLIRSLEATDGEGIFLDVAENTVWVSGNHESYSVVHNGVEYDLAPDGSGEGYIQFSFTLEEVADGEQLVFSKNGLVVNAGPEEGAGNNATTDDYKGNTCCKVTTGGKNISVYLKVYENRYEVWVGQPQGEMVTVTFTINYGTENGQGVYIVGDFCEWDPTKGIRGTWTEGNNWVFEIKVPVDTVWSFKFVINNYDEPSDPAIRWEADPNRSYTFSSDGSETFSWQA